MGRILRSALRLALAVALIGGCAAPTLPLPPPIVPTFSEASTQGQVKLAYNQGGGVEPFALVLIFNTNPTLPPDERVGGTQADALGNWNAVIFGKVGDTVEISQQDPTTLEWSPPLTAQIQFH